MNFFLPYAQSFKQDFNYLIGTSGCFTEAVSPGSTAPATGVVKGIVVVGDDGGCIDAQMQCLALREALRDDAYLIGKPWLFKYRVYLIHQQLDDDTTLYYRELGESLDQQGISFVPGKYHD
jgi:hypothetical protein